MAFRATLNFQKFKVALNATNRILPPPTEFYLFKVNLFVHGTGRRSSQRNEQLLAVVSLLFGVRETNCLQGTTIRAYQFCYHGNIIGSIPPQYKRHLWPPLVFHFHICKWCPIYMIQHAYKYVSLSLWPCLTFSSWKSLTYWNQVGGDWKRVSFHWNIMFYNRRSLPSLNGLCCKLAKIALFIYLM